MTHQINRRSFVASIPAVALCASADASQDDTFMEHYRVWIDARKRFNELSYLTINTCTDEQEARLDSIWLTGDNALDQMAEIIPSSPEALAAMTHVIWASHGLQLSVTNPDYVKELGFVDNKLILNLHRALSGGKEMPQTA